jgi:hypothetical protein
MPAAGPRKFTHSPTATRNVILSPTDKTNRFGAPSRFNFSAFKSKKPGTIEKYVKASSGLKNGTLSNMTPSTNKSEHNAAISQSPRFDLFIQSPENGLQSVY